MLYLHALEQQQLSKPSVPPTTTLLFISRLLTQFSSSCCCYICFIYLFCRLLQPTRVLSMKVSGKNSGGFFLQIVWLICTTRGPCSRNKRHFRSNFSLTSYTHNLTSSLVPVIGYPVRTLSDLRPGKRHFAREPLSVPALCGRAKPLPCGILWDVLPGGPTIGRPLYNQRASALWSNILCLLSQEAPWTACWSAASTSL